MLIMILHVFSVPEQALNTDINGQITETELEKAIKCLKMVRVAGLMIL